MIKQTNGKFFCALLLFVGILLPNKFAWCAENQKVVFINEREKKPDGGYSTSDKYDIYIINYDGTGLKKLAEKGINPVPSPDGKKIAFIPIRILEDQLGVSVINVDRTEKRDVVKRAPMEGGVTAFYSFLRWSPDSTKIAYVFASGKGTQQKVTSWVVDITTGEKKELSFNLENIPVLSWSQDSNEILAGSLSKPNRYVVINIKTDEKKILPIEKLDITPNKLVLLDRKKLLFYKDLFFWTINRDGSNMQQLMRIGNLLETGAFLKTDFILLTEKKVRMLIDESQNEKPGVKLYEADLATGKLSPITRIVDSSFGYLGLFSKDGKKVLNFVEDRKNFTQKLTVNDVKTSKEYILCDPWKTFRQETFVGYENVNWVN